MFEPRPIRMSKSFIFFLYTALLHYFTLHIDWLHFWHYLWMKNKIEVYPCTCLKFMHVCVCVLSLSMVLSIPNNATCALPNQVGLQAFGTGLLFSFYLISILNLETSKEHYLALTVGWHIYSELKSISEKQYEARSLQIPFIGLNENAVCIDLAACQQFTKSYTTWDTHSYIYHDKNISSVSSNSVR